MKAILKKNKEKGFSYDEIEIPKTGDDQVLIRIKAAAICGSDLNFYVWNSSFCDGLVKNLPFIPGHECSGVVVDAGRSIKWLSKGDRVAVETHIPCGHCHQCLIGRPHTCLNMKLFGHNVNGCFAEYCAVEASAVRKIPDGLTFEQGAMLEPLGVVIRPVLDSDIEMSVLCVTGCGPIGQFAIALAAAAGAYRIIAVDVDNGRLELAKKMGATETINSIIDPAFSRHLIDTTNGGIDVFLEASGNVSALNEGLRSLRYGGGMYMIGQPKQPLIIEDPMRLITLKEVTIKGTWGRELYKSWEKAERFLLSNRIDIDQIITHRFRMEDFEAAFETAINKEGCKIILLPSEEV